MFSKQFILSLILSIAITIEVSNGKALNTKDYYQLTPSYPHSEDNLALVIPQDDNNYVALPSTADGNFEFDIILSENGDRQIGSIEGMPLKPSLEVKQKENESPKLDDQITVRQKGLKRHKSSCIGSVITMALCY